MSGGPEGAAPRGDGRPEPRSGIGDRVIRRRITRPTGRLYSRFVTLMKFVLPAAGLAMLALVAAWPSLTELPTPRISADEGQLEMIGPRYFSEDEANQPYSVTAARADQSNAYPGLLELAEPEAEMTQNDGTWVTMRSDHGWYDRTSGILRMVGSVRVMRDDGSEFTTAEAYSDVRAGSAWGDRRVIGQGPQGEIDARGFRLTDRGRSVVFIDNAKAGVAQRNAAPAGGNPPPPAPPVQTAEQPADAPPRVRLAPLPPVKPPAPRSQGGRM